MLDQTLMRMAQAWLYGWDAAVADKPESVCPFAAEIADNQFRCWWQRGWAAGCRNDRAAKNHFVALSLGIHHE